MKTINIYQGEWIDKWNEKKKKIAHSFSARDVLFKNFVM